MTTKLLAKIRYGLNGVTGWLTKKAICPACGSTINRALDRKYFVFRLEECANCHLLYRFPPDPQETASALYEDQCTESGFTWDLPNDNELERLKASAFEGTFRDIRRVVDILDCLRVKRDARLLDFGASWGYQTFQFRRHGYRTEAYEVCKARAAAGARLGIEIKTDLNSLSGKYDVVYSSHVLEHVNNPLEVLKTKLALTAPGGFVVALTPNGSEAYKQANRPAFHQSWGAIHPVLLSAKFVERNFSSAPGWVGCSDVGRELKVWSQDTFLVASASGWELLLVLKRAEDGKVL